MAESTHRIRRQRWVVHAGSAAQAFTLRRQLRADWVTRLQPAFEQAFGAADRPGVTLRIPKLELQFKLPAGDDFVERLAELLERELREQLLDACRPGLPSTRTEEPSRVPIAQSEFDGLLAYLRSGLLGWEVAGLPGRPGEAFKALCRRHYALLQAHLEQHQESAPFYFRLWQLLDRDPAPPDAPPRPVAPGDGFANLLAYLRSGLVVWAVPSPGPRPLVEFTETCRQAWPRLRAHLGDTAEAAPFYHRLWQILEREEAQTLAGLVTQALPEEWIAPAQDLLVLLLTGANGLLSSDRRRQLASAFGTELLQEFGARRTLLGTLPDEPGMMPAPFKSFIQSTLTTAERSALRSQLAAWSPAAADWLAAVVSPPTPAAQVEPTPSTALPGEVLPPPNPTVNQLPPDGPAVPTVGAGPPPAAVTFPPGPVAPPPFTARSADRDAAPPLTVFHAGLVLLHPFLPRFLAACNLPWAPAQPFTEWGLARAAALLHHLATGGEAIQEYELNWIKVLLGLLPETPLCVGPGWVTGEDRREAEAMLASVITHWTALKASTPAGLREAFLSRSGLLRGDENGWRLQLERTSIDLLLDRLPWSFGVVKLPWMKQPVYVEW